MRINDKHPNKAGIYKLTCETTEKVYIGKAVNLNLRIKKHRYSKGRCYFENAILKYGWQTFTVEILEIFENFNKLKDKGNLLNRETYYIGLFDSTNREKGYNTCKYSTDRTGVSCSEETKEKIRQSLLGRKISEETREKRKSIIVSEETREKIRRGRTGKKHSKETLEKMRNPRKSKTTK